MLKITKQQFQIKIPTKNPYKFYSKKYKNSNASLIVAASAALESYKNEKQKFYKRNLFDYKQRLGRL